MIAALYTQGGGFDIREVPVPEMADDEVLVRVVASSICGTDVRVIRHGQRKLEDGQTVVLGHEFSGVIERVGARVSGFQAGQRIGVAPNIGCGQCALCARGMPNMCPDYTAFGINIDGAHTRYARIPAAAIAQGSVFVLPPELPFTEAALLEPLSCVVNGQHAAGVALGDTVVIFGAGPIGLMHLMLARQRGAIKVLMVDTLPDRLEKALDLGADRAVNPTTDDVRDRIFAETNGWGADVVITACSVAEVQTQAVTLLAPLGRLCLFGGLPRGQSTVPLDTNPIHYKNLTVTGVTGGSPRDYRLAMDLVAAGRLDLSKVISHTFDGSDMAKAFDTALNEPTLKVVIQHGTA